MTKISDLKVGDKIYYFDDVDFEHLDFDTINKCEPEEITDIDNDYNHYGCKYEICLGRGENACYIPIKEECDEIYRTKEELIKAYIEFLEYGIGWGKKQLKLAKEWAVND